MKLLLASVLLGAMVLPSVAAEHEPPLHGGALVMAAPPESVIPKPPTPALPLDVLAMKDYLIARSYYTATVSVKYTEEDHNKYVAKLDAAPARDIKNWHFASTTRSQQATRGYAASQQATMMRIQQTRDQAARNQLPYKRAATHQQFRPSPIRNNGYPYHYNGYHGYYNRYHGYYPYYR